MYGARRQFFTWRKKGAAATHPPGTETETETETTETTAPTSAPPQPNAPRDRIRRAGRASAQPPHSDIDIARTGRRQNLANSVPELCGSHVGKWKHVPLRGWASTAATCKSIGWGTHFPCGPGLQKNQQFTHLPAKFGGT